jgi:hypothetical protein
VIKKEAKGCRPEMKGLRYKTKWSRAYGRGATVEPGAKGCRAEMKGLRFCC